jgi:D-tyrosyl-tRNA(Tyr) deacylase
VKQAGDSVKADHPGNFGRAPARRRRYNHRSFDGSDFGPGVGMRAVVQRVSRAAVVIDGETVGAVGRGLLVLLGVAPDDKPDNARWLAEKIAGLRIFADEAGKMNRDVAEVGGGVLVVSQFTLYGDCRKGRRPSFIGAAPPEIAVPLYEEFVNAMRALGLPVATGRFGAMMGVELVNDGPVTLILDTRDV